MRLIPPYFTELRKRNSPVIRKMKRKKGKKRRKIVRNKYNGKKTREGTYYKKLSRLFLYNFLTSKGTDMNCCLRNISQPKYLNNF
jgi:hypothetical protein